MKTFLLLTLLGVLFACSLAAPAKHTNVRRSDSDSRDGPQSSDDTTAMASGSGSMSMSEDGNSSSISEDSSSQSSASNEDSSEDDDSTNGAMTATGSAGQGNPAVIDTNANVRPTDAVTAAEVFTTEEIMNMNPNADPPSASP